MKITILNKGILNSKSVASDSYVKSLFNGNSNDYSLWGGNEYNYNIMNDALNATEAGRKLMNGVGTNQQITDYFKTQGLTVDHDNNGMLNFGAYTPEQKQGGLLEQVNDFFGSNTFKGLMGIGSLAQGIFNGYMGYQAFKENKKNMELQRSIAKENQARQRHEWQRQDANRASISASWNR
jgi:hypothetical protein